MEESVITVPVEAIPEESVEGAGMELDGQLPMLDTAVETSVEMETPMEQNTGSFHLDGGGFRGVLHRGGLLLGDLLGHGFLEGAGVLLHGGRQTPDYTT